jgi:hypothetical protein
MSFAVAPLANVGHRGPDALEHTKSIPDAVDYFSFIHAAIQPCVHTVVHGDVLHEAPLG